MKIRQTPDSWSDEDSVESETRRAVLAWRLRGDEDAARWLVQIYRPLVRSIVHRLPSPWQAEDAEQETLVRVFAALDRYDLSQPFGPWIGTIARNVLLNTYRSHRSHERQLDRSGLESSLEIPSRCRPDAALMARERLMSVFAHLDEFDARASRIFRLHVFCGLSADDISELVGASQAAVRVCVHRTRGALRARMAAES